MRRTIHLTIVTAAILSLLAFPRAVQAQWYGHGPGGRVYVGFGWGYPYWGYPYSWGWGYPYWGWGPYWGGGPWYGYPYWGYPDNSAELKLEVTPKDAQVYLDGYYVGVVDDYDGVFQRLHMRPGDHELVIYKPEFRTVKQNIRVAPRQDSKVRYALQPLPAGETAEPPPPPPKEVEPRESVPPSEAPGRMPPRAPPSPSGEASSFGTLVFRVQPADADILIDGNRWQGLEGGERLAVEVAGGTHHVEIRKDGFVTFTTDVTVRPGETTPLNVSLPRGE